MIKTYQSLMFYLNLDAVITLNKLFNINTLQVFNIPKKHNVLCKLFILGIAMHIDMFLTNTRNQCTYDQQ